MKLVYILLGILLISSTTAFSQSKLGCKKTCFVENRVYEGAQLGAKLKPNCGDKGAYITEVVSNSAAENALLKPNDLLLSVNGIQIDYPAHFKRILKKLEAFQEVTLVFERKSKVYTTQVVLDPEITKIIQEEVCCDALSFKENVTVYPNPASKNVHIAFKNVVAGSYDFEIFNLNGVRFFSAENSKLNNQLTKTINIEKLDEGVYVLKIKQAENIYSSLFAVKKY